MCLSDERTIRWEWRGSPPVIGGRTISWLPDFLKLIFARRIFRANSAFSVWAAWLSDAEVISPWLHEYAPSREIDVKFVRGNHPHWMSVKGVHANYEFEIKNDLKDSYMENEKSVMEVTNKKPKVVVSPKEKSSKKEKDVIMMVHWNGRFGNRCGSYVFGRNYAELHDLDFYIPSEWEGTQLFVDKGYKLSLIHI